MSWPIVITLAAVGLAAVAALLWLGWWRFPKRQVDRLRLTLRDPKARADIEDNLRKTIGQLIGGAAVLIGAGLAYLQFTQQQHASQQQFLQQQQASRDLLISNQVAKGFEQLAARADARPMLHTELTEEIACGTALRCAPVPISGPRHLIAQWHSIEDAPVAEPRQVERLVAPVQ
jgi:ABC-type transport system involved in cytochrome c biogenesis permease subunit